MFKNSMKIAMRNFLKHKGFSFINVFGLAVGIACCLLIVLYVLDETSYEKGNPKADRVYRIGLHAFLNNKPIDVVVGCAPLAPTLAKEVPEVESAARARNFGFPVFRYGEKVFSEERVFSVDPAFCDIFAVRFLHGDPKTALEKPETLVVTKSMAAKYFGAEDPMGKVIRSDNRRNYLVTGVIEDCPPNTHLHYDFLASLATYADSRSTIWINNNYYVYVLLRPGASPKAFEAKLADLVKKYVGPQVQAAIGTSLEQFFKSGGQYRYFIQPLTSIHLTSHYDAEAEPNSDVSYVYIFSAIAVGILLVACFNFINLSTARAANRAREVGVRKTLGSSQDQLVRQFLTEAMLMSFLAVLGALAIVQLSLPAFNRLIGKHVFIPYFQNIAVIPSLLGLAVATGLIAGLYPAFFLASFDPATVLKTETVGSRRKSRLRNVLVVFQFAVSIILIVGTLIVQRQLHFIQNKNLGFEKEQLVIIKKTDDLADRLAGFKQELLNNPNIVVASNSTNLVSGQYGNSVFQIPGPAGQENHLLWTSTADPDFVKTYKISMIAGRFFEKDRPADLRSVVINEAAARELGWTEAVDKQLFAPGPTAGQGQPLTVIGVMKDFHFESLHRPIRPLIMGILRSGAAGRFVTVRIGTQNVRATMAFLEATWKKFALNQAFEYEFFDDYFARVYLAEYRTGTIFLYFSMLAIIIACLGLFGLASFVTEQRTREIGIRKVLGASVSDVVLLLTGQFVRWVLIGNLFAWPIAYLVMKKWLQRFAFQAGFSVWTLLIASLLMLVFALVTVSYQTIRSAMTNPARSLKFE
jgi:putative ABC transport system permease protein